MAKTLLLMEALKAQQKRHRLEHQAESSFKPIAERSYFAEKNCRA
jgi:hypothetical protein